MTTIAILFVVILTLFQIRNTWVYKVRKKLIWTDYTSFRLLPSYGSMIRKFWIWNVYKFVPRNMERRNER